MVRRIAAVVSLTPFLASLALAGGPRDVTHEESAEIRERLEWFYGRRGMMPGSADANASKYGVLRAQAARETQRRIAAQKQSLRAPSVWTNIGPSPIDNNSQAGPDSGRVTSVAILPSNPNIMYLGAASGGLWKTTDGGASWVSLFETMPTQTIGSVAISPTDPNTIWVGTGDYFAGDTYFGMGIFRSTDAGLTFEDRTGTSPTHMALTAISKVILHPTDPSLVIVGGTMIREATGASEGGIFRSTNAGATWTMVFDRKTNEIVRHPTNTSILFAARRGTSTGPEYGCVKSTDGGATWLDAAVGLNTAGSNTDIALSPSDPNVLYFLSEDSVSPPNQTPLFKSTDGAATWTQVNANACEGQCFYNMTMKVSSNDPNTLYVGTIRPFKSVNGGTTLTALSGYGQKLHPDVQYIERHPTDPNTIFVGTDGGLWKTADAGVTFANLNGNLNLTQFYHVATHPTLETVMLGGSQDNGHAKYRGVPDWLNTAPTGDGMYSAIHPTDPTYWYAGTYPGAPAPGPTNIYRSTNSSANWQYISSDITDPSAWVCPFIFDPVVPDTMYAGTRSNVWRSTDRGSNWTKITTTAFASAVLSLAVAPSNNQIIYASAGAKLHRSTDYGATWADVTGNMPVRTITDIAVDPGNPMHVYVTTAGFFTTTVNVTTTGGTTWTSIVNGLPQVAAEAVLLVPNPYRIYIGTDVGIFVGYSDAGPFVPDMNGFAQGVPVTELIYTPATNAITAGTYGRGAWRKDAGAPMAYNVSVGKGGASAATYDSRINAYRGDGAHILAVDFLGFSATGYGVNVTGGDVTGDGQAEILAGQGPGPTHPPVGKIFKADGTPLTGGSFTAYAGSGYGLNIAGGDVDGDGAAEILTGPGEGAVYGPQVRGWNHDGTGAVTAIGKINFFAYSTLKYGANVAGASFDTDATWSEIVSGAGPGDVFGPHVRGWNFDGGTITASAKVNFFAYSTLKYGVNVSGGDIDRDGFDELLTGPGPGTVFTPQVRGFNVDGGTAASMAKVNFLAYGTGRYGANVVGADVDADGFFEIATGQGPDPAAVAALKGWNFDGVTLLEITAMSKNAWPGLTYGLTVGAGTFGY